MVLKNKTAKLLDFDHPQKSQLGLGDCINFTITIIVIKTSRFPIISDFVIIWKSIAYLQFKECLLLFYSLLYVVT